MAKFLKSIFHPTDRRKSPHYENEAEEERSESPQMGNKRQLSISRSGRMKQANKKRHSLTLELYGETIQIDPVETPKSMEYHVHSPMSLTAPADLCVSDTTRFEDPPNVEDPVEKSMDVSTLDSSLGIKPRSFAAKSPEEEIDNAFEIIDKS